MSDRVKKFKRIRIGTWIRFVVLLLGAVIFVVPLLWMFATAIKPIDQTMSMPPTWIPTMSFVQVDGERVSVGGIEEVSDDRVSARAAYQWTIEVDGDSVPVRRLDLDPTLTSETEIVDVEISYHYEMDVDGVSLPVKHTVMAELSEGQGETFEVSVFYPDGYIERRTASAYDLVRVNNRLSREKDQAYALVDQTRVPASVIRRGFLNWDDRLKAVFVQTEAFDLSADAIETVVAPRWGNFPAATAEMQRFPRYLMNTLLLCFLCVLGTVCSCTLVAYGFSRIDWPGRDKVFVVVLATMMIPFPVIMVPLYGLFREIGWIGTLKPLWVPTFFASAFNVFLLRQFFRTIPKELSESARIDGCNEFRIFLQIILPLARPAVVVVALFQFLYTWNDFLGPLIYLTDQDDYTLALGLQFFQSQQGGTQWHYLMAASTLVVAPIIVLFFLAQRTFIEGVSMSGLKG